MLTSGASRWIWIALGATSITFHLWLIFSGLVPNLLSRPLHMALALPWAMIFIARTSVERISGAVLGSLGLAACLWIAWNQDALSDQYGFLEGSFQVGIAIILLVTVLEMARRAIGWPLPLVASITLLYGLFGQYIPGEFGHPGTPLNSFLGTLTIAEGGLWGSLTGVSVSIVAIFVIFGAVLNAGEAGQGFMNVAAAVAGRLRGGAAKVSVLSSALFGSISGSASANVASTGAITLPAMTRLGYPRSLAGAVEAVASSGGQIMPPLMGAGAFVMVELTGTPYTEIMAAALLPAFLYFAACWIGIDAFSMRYKLEGLPKDQQPGLRPVLITAAFFMVPFTVLLWFMFYAGFTPQYAACLAILAGAVLLLLDAKLSFSGPRTIDRIISVCLTAGQQIATIASIILCASIIIGVLGITGLGVKITSLILSGSGGMLWPALLLTAAACLILGMEVPTTAAYVICISVAGPALIELGLQPLQAHLFVFWFALLSTITPPVCGAVFIAAGMVGENWLKVAGKAMALGIGLYLIPLGMIANPDLIQLSTVPIHAVLAAAKVGVGLGCISFGIIAPIRWMMRIALVLGGALVLFYPV
ncbi:MAG TPA: TRAP transporter permease DctM/Q [Rhodospirillaceae bacterium]|nr:TRAP transporter permease DctM/Q [Rhodospirillaceae bacterium]MAX60927.1 TRAP transporter permease DctM/Q [Rhodospirillaceae bacterium]MAX65249.1 TRAP transporter permease DctM/Q [Rhodospirillaceae bacterium]MBB55664.1 TRAP transporter permease DctM/Q [Rhodospirillaceae bacterium]HAD99964.1 TRAP transporter permease DctM/Q [Rhodospirillaceae bacterium]|tara:strand:+ start:21370 stop:23139 length:1770 start_codon:yes stop_codon:yes gene_type:complete